MERDSIELGTLNVDKLFRKYFIPTLLGMLSMSAVTAIDGIFVGHGVGSDGIAAINICIPLYMFLTGIGLMAGAGCSVVASIHLAQGRQKAARLNVTQAFLFVAAVALAITLPVMVAPDAVGLALGASDSLLPLVRCYMLWFAPSWVFQICGSVAMFTIRLDGSPRIAMWCCLVVAIANTVLDWLFIFPFGWGLMGAALASSLSIVIGCLAGMGYMVFAASHLRLFMPKFSRKSLKLSLRNIGYQCRIGSPALLGECTMAVLMFAGNLTFMHYLGDKGVGAFGIACYYAPFVFMVGNAIAQSMQPIVSYNFGRGQSLRVRQALHTGLATAVVCGLLVSSAFVFAPGMMVRLFVAPSDPAASVAVSGFPLFAAGFVFFIVNLTSIGYFQSMERIRPATAFAMLRGFALLVPSFCILPLCFGNAGIWLAMPVSEALTTLAVAVFCAMSAKTAQKRLAGQANP